MFAFTFIPCIAALALGSTPAAEPTIDPFRIADAFDAKVIEVVAQRNDDPNTSLVLMAGRATIVWPAAAGHELLHADPVKHPNGIEIGLGTIVVAEKDAVLSWQSQKDAVAWHFDARTIVVDQRIHDIWVDAFRQTGDPTVLADDSHIAESNRDFALWVEDARRNPAEHGLTPAEVPDSRWTPCEARCEAGWSPYCGEDRHTNRCMCVRIATFDEPNPPATAAGPGAGGLCRAWRAPRPNQR